MLSTQYGVQWGSRDVLLAAGLLRVSVSWAQVFILFHSVCGQAWIGKPLHLDQQIYNAMRRLWASHNNIPWEVFSKRTSSWSVCPFWSWQRVRRAN